MRNPFTGLMLLQTLSRRANTKHKGGPKIDNWAPNPRLEIKGKFLLLG